MRVHHLDGRLFVKSTPQSFDVVIVNLPDPQTAQLNRFDTAEFFREVAKKLTSGGVLAIQLRAAEDYISPELSEFLRCINQTLGEVFSEIRVIPGDPIHIFGSRRPGVLANDAGELVSRLRARNLQTSYVREYYFPFRMMPDRMQELETQIRPQPGTTRNRDFVPLAYYFDATLWSAQFDCEYSRWFRWLGRVRFAVVARVVHGPGHHVQVRPVRSIDEFAVHQVPSQAELPRARIDRRFHEVWPSAVNEQPHHYSRVDLPQRPQRFRIEGKGDRARRILRILQRRHQRVVHAPRAVVLDLQVKDYIVLPREFEHLIERGNLRAHKLPVEPHTRVELPQLGERSIFHRPLAIGGALERWIVYRNETRIPRQVQVGFDESRAQLNRPLKSHERVFGCVPGGASVRDNPRVSHQFCLC